MYLLQYVTGVMFYKTRFYKDIMKKIQNDKINNILLVSYTGSIFIGLSMAAIGTLVMENGMFVGIYSGFYGKANVTGKIFLLIIMEM